MQRDARRPRRHPRAAADPQRQDTSTPPTRRTPEVVQIETAMGAAIEVFDGARTIEVGRDRFVPVKTTNDLLVLRSDIYDLGRDFVLDQASDDVPYVDLDARLLQAGRRLRQALPRGRAVAARGLVVHASTATSPSATASRWSATSSLDADLGPAGRRRHRAQRVRWLTASTPVDELPRHASWPSGRAAARLPAAADGGARAGGAPRTSSPTSSLPSFDNSAMDGYAVRAGRRRHGQRRAARCSCRSSATSAPARPSCWRCRPGTAVKIMTGAPMPAGADAVVPFEWTDRGVAQRARSTQAPELGQHVRRAARTSPRATCCVEHGTVLGPRQLGLLAAVGRAARAVAAAPAGRRHLHRQRAARARHRSWATTRSTTPTPTCWPPPPARPARSPTASASCPTTRARSPTRSSDQLVRADLVVTTGGVSEGAYDVVKEALSPLGTVRFDKVAMQPGKPQGFGVIGEDGTPIFTLPGNPVSAYVSFEVFVLPGAAPDDGQAARTRARPSRARLTQPVSVAGGQAPVRARLRHDVDRGGAFVDARSAARARTCSATWPRQRAGRRAGGDARRSAAGEMVQVLRLDEELLSVPSSDRLTHVDESGAARMVDVSGKDVTARTATASGPGAGLAPRSSRCCAARACPRATPSRWRGSPASWAPSGPRR